MVFRFKQFEINQDKCAMKIGTDGVLLGAWSPADRAQTILDIGTGTGIVTLMLAQRNPTATITAVEVEKAAAEQAADNFAASPWRDRLSVRNAPIQTFTAEASPLLKFDLIVANPPFFGSDPKKASTPRTQARTTATLTHPQLLQCAAQLLAPNGHFAVILPAQTALVFKQSALLQGLFCWRQTGVRPKADKPVLRVLMVFARDKSVCQQDELVVQRAAANDYTDDYSNLTRDFYLWI